jgi:hypothetical protein
VFFWQALQKQVYLDKVLWVYFVYIYGSYISRSGPKFEKKLLLENKQILKQI